MRLTADFLRRLTREQRARVLGQLSSAEKEALYYHWPFWRRPNQAPPDGRWLVWLIRSGRGFGKTRMGAEWTIECAAQPAVCGGLIALVGRTAADVRDTMIQGESGILARSPPWFRPVYEPSKRRLTWPNGVRGIAYSSQEPDQLRGPQHGRAWCDEPAHWFNPTEAWDNLRMGLRLGPDPRIVGTTTPLPTRFIRDLVRDKRTVSTIGSTLDNRANLPAEWLEDLLAKYRGTRIGRQELDGEILDENPDALWRHAMFDAHRRTWLPDLVRVSVAIDPAVTNNAGSDDTGINVAGRDANGEAHVIADLTCHLSPDGWARRAVQAVREYQADEIVCEVNNGGDLVESVIRSVDSTVRIVKVRATRRKRVRAEPVAALYEQGRVHHFMTKVEDADGTHRMVNRLETLEDHLVDFEPEGGDSPDDDVDALVWNLTHLMLSDDVRSGERLRARAS